MPKQEILLTPVILKLNTSLLNLPNGNAWNYELFRNNNGEWKKSGNQFEKNNVTISTLINELVMI